MENKMGKVYITGAGCGEADLITLRGMRALMGCDTLVYDSLIARELLNLAPDTAEKIYVGKRGGHHSMSQEEINELLCAKALAGRTVVRLKGGDPYVFGRGSEEILALRAYGIPYEEIPGISSAIGIPAAAGIPVTHRGISRSLHVITAHTADSADGLPERLEALAKLDGTLVFLMGLSQLALLAQRLIAAGMDENTPAAVLSGGNAEHHADVRGTLGTIAHRAGEAEVKPPAVIVIGQVAAMDLAPTPRAPLSGRRIALTGTRAVADKLREAFGALGAVTLIAERAAVRELETEIPLSELGDEKEKLLVFTSANGVDVFFSRLRKSRFDLRSLQGCRFAVIGSATGEKLAQYGIYAEICPERYTSEMLATKIEESWREGRVYLFRSEEGSQALAERLSRSFPVSDLRIYTVEREIMDEGLREDADYVTFSSAAGVRSYFAARKSLPPSAIPVVVGEVTRAELAHYYRGEIVSAGDCTADGMVKAVLERENDRK